MKRGDLVKEWLFDDPSRPDADGKPWECWRYGLVLVPNCGQTIGSGMTEVLWSADGDYHTGASGKLYKQKTKASRLEVISPCKR
jgi:hypothetical protein